MAWRPSPSYYAFQLRAPGQCLSPQNHGLGGSSIPTSDSVPCLALWSQQLGPYSSPESLVELKGEEPDWQSKCPEQNGGQREVLWPVSTARLQGGEAMVSFSPQAGDRRGLGSFSPGGLCCLGPREERTGLAWNCGLSQWARWWNVVLRGGLDGR